MNSRSLNDPRQVNEPFSRLQITISRYAQHLNWLFTHDQLQGNEQGWLGAEAHYNSTIIIL